jgi:hypothetical protein
MTLNARLLWFRLAYVACLVFVFRSSPLSLWALVALVGLELGLGSLKLFRETQLTSGREARLNAKLGTLQTKYDELEEKLRQLTNRGH